MTLLVSLFCCFIACGGTKRVKRQTDDRTAHQPMLPLKDSEETVVVCPQVLLSSNAYPGTLSPSPTPLSSPTLYTLPASHSTENKLRIDKWKAIIRKLSLHNELRSVWNELKVRGGFSTNEDFIIHLLRRESERQCVEYDVLASKPPPDVSDVTNYGVDTPSDMANSPEVSVNFESDTLSCKTDTVTDVRCNSVGLLQKDSTGVAEYASKLGTLCQQPDCSSRQYELTVLDSQKKHAKDDTDLEFPVDEVIDCL
ncbi:hypothetical protein GBAR_LOCUS13490 [Geodia barretti]|uniref:Uncharacterized protein n=1 Tax=Geodia barretti TaxID=519541 RepID=A0AA35S6X2_GEOBA|nr:hypothetical protein GBAR_LOCUS13490 [Geodia barretti]